jgi:hypothetical protein
VIRFHFVVREEYWVRVGKDSGNQTLMVCGHLSFDAHTRHPLLDGLPYHMGVREGNVVSGSWFDLTLQYLEQGAKFGQFGTEAIVKRLTKIIFIQVINAWLDQEQPKYGLLTILADRRL